MALENIYKKASLVMKPAAMKEGKLYSQQPHSGDGDFTFSRANGTQTRINKHGLIESVSDNTPRLSYELDANGNVSECPVLLLEPTRVNNLPESENFGTDWVAIGLTVSNGITSPDGGTNAYSLIEGTGTGGKIIYDTISVSAGSVTYSLFMKKGDKRYTALLLSGVVTTSMFNVDLENGTGTTVTGSFDSTNIEQYPNGWYRISVTATATAGNLNCNVYLMNGSTYNDRNYTGNGTDKTYVFGAQLEEGSYATSYIPTTSAAAERTSDFVSGGGNSDTFNDSEGVLFAELEAFGDGTATRKISLSNGSTDFVNIQFTTTSGEVAFDFGSTNNNFTSVSVTGQTPTSRNKIAIKYKSGDVDCYINGTRVTGSSLTFTLSGLDRVNFDWRGGTGIQNMFAKIYQVMVFNTALSDSELIELTS